MHIFLLSQPNWGGLFYACIVSKYRDFAPLFRENYHDVLLMKLVLPNLSITKYIVPAIHAVYNRIVDVWLKQQEIINFMPIKLYCIDKVKVTVVEPHTHIRKHIKCA